MMKRRIQERKFFYPLIYILLLGLSVLPPFMPHLHSRQKKLQVIFQVLQHASIHSFHG